MQALSAKISGRILKAARDQQEEIDAEEDEGRERVQVRSEFTPPSDLAPTAHHAQINAGALAAALQRMKDSDDEDDDEEEDLGAGYDGYDSIYGAEVMKNIFNFKI